MKQLMNLLPLIISLTVIKWVKCFYYFFTFYYFYFFGCKVINYVNKLLQKKRLKLNAEGEVIEGAEDDSSQMSDMHVTVVDPATGR